MKQIQLFHISTKTNLDSSLINPRIPRNKYENEDSITPRICCSTTIEGCLKAVPRLPNTDFIIYCPQSLDEKGQINCIKPSCIDVPDVEETDEVWVLEPVVFFKWGILKVKNILNIYKIVADDGMMVEICNYEFTIKQDIIKKNLFFQF